MGLLSSMASGLGGLVAGPFGAVLGSAVDTVANNYFNKKAASQQNAYQWDFWHANNDYNSPKSQMQRLEEAGLNPNLVYGNGGATHQATMATAPKVNPARSNILASLGAMNVFNQMENTEAQTADIKSSTLNNLVLTNQRAGLFALEREILKHNLEIGKKYGIPVGSTNTMTNVDSYGRYLGNLAGGF